MKLSKIFLVLFLTQVIHIGCVKKQVEPKTIARKKSDSIDFAFQTEIKFAKGFKVINHARHKEIIVFHPETRDTLSVYITALHDTSLPDNIKTKGIHISVPAQTIACLSTTHVGAVEILNLHEKLIGAGTPEYIWDKKIQNRIAQGKIKEIGRGMGFNLEKIVALEPDILMQNYMDKTDVDGNLTNLGIAVVYNNAWREETLLARAEWLKLMGLLFGKEQMADSIFNKVVCNYNEIKNTASKAERKPTVMYGHDFKGVWYLPQDKTYSVEAIRDANANLKTAGAGSKSLPKSFEEVFEMYHDAEYWLSTHSKIQDMDEFLSTNPRYGEFQATKNNKVYLNNKREKPDGGNDYWESGINRPDLLLKDIVKILHPELYPEYECIYWKHLE
ncbi:iron complex transport system substrate-binding protein [Balneicella halophila]|uniref:Iron complex transport system substrate-binding protein n=1 Tax=Balneicella halophila TaxID=1537566 RepID=A0A7L4UN80_BALHA|nr:ABC transporter substrate-binding protein [Balneicella halophila]PVX49999.1 iron complex transport system substrate-binding protein [Balneicella halophila]